MSSRTKWLLAGPVLALLITVGPSLMPAPAHGATPPPPPVSPFAAVSPVVTPLKLFLTLAGVLALAAAVLVLWRRSAGARIGAGSATRTLVVRETLRLSARSRLHLISAGTRSLLVAEGEKGISLLHLTAPAESAQQRLRSAGAEAEAAEERMPTARRAGAGARGEEEDEGAVPRDMVLTPAPRRKKGIPDGADFRKLLEQVRAESTT
jgi:flagellar biogenesis protein FliO